MASFYRGIFIKRYIMILHIISFSPPECRVLLEIEAMFVSMSISVVCFGRPVITRNQKANYYSFIKTPLIRRGNFSVSGDF